MPGKRKRERPVTQKILRWGGFRHPLLESHNCVINVYRECKSERNSPRLLFYYLVTRSCVCYFSFSLFVSSFEFFQFYIWKNLLMQPEITTLSVYHISQKKVLESRPQGLWRAEHRRFDTNDESPWPAESSTKPGMMELPKSPTTNKQKIKLFDHKIANKLPSVSSNRWSGSQTHFALVLSPPQSLKSFCGFGICDASAHVDAMRGRRWNSRRQQRAMM